MPILLVQCDLFNFGGGKSSPPPEPKPIHKISIPYNWNGDLLVYAHGFVEPRDDLAIPHDTIDGVALSSLVEKNGLAYATTSYPHTGLNGPEAVADLDSLVSQFENANGQPNHIYLAGVSEGGFITTMAIEQHPQIYDAGIAACGPIGNFEKQLNYFGNFHVLFHYFFPDVQIGSPIGVSDQTIEQWESGDLQDEIKSLIESHPDKARTLLKVANVPVKDLQDIEEVKTAILGILRHNVLSTNDAIRRLGGEPFQNTPFDNSSIKYTGTGSSSEDSKLNQNVERFQADPDLLAVINTNFHTTGQLSRPLIAPYTIYDPIVPEWQDSIYKSKADPRNLFKEVPMDKFGHCKFTTQELTDILKNLITGKGS